MSQDVPAALLACSGTESTAHPGKLPPHRRFTAWFAEKNRLGDGKRDQMNSANLLEGLGENMNEESKQQASPDTVLQSQVHFQVRCKANTTIPKSASRWFPSACPHPETQPSSKPSYWYRSNPFCLKQMFSLPFPLKNSKPHTSEGSPGKGGFRLQVPEGEGKAAAEPSATPGSRQAIGCCCNKSKSVMGNVKLSFGNHSLWIIQSLTFTSNNHSSHPHTQFSLLLSFKLSLIISINLLHYYFILISCRGRGQQFDKAQRTGRLWAVLLLLLPNFAGLLRTRARARTPQPRAHLWHHSKPFSREQHSCPQPHHRTSIPSTVQLGRSRCLHISPSPK